MDGGCRVGHQRSRRHRRARLGWAQQLDQLRRRDAPQLRRSPEVLDGSARRRFCAGQRHGHDLGVHWRLAALDRIRTRLRIVQRHAGYEGRVREPIPVASAAGRHLGHYAGRRVRRRGARSRKGRRVGAKSARLRVQADLGHHRRGRRRSSARGVHPRIFAPQSRGCCQRSGYCRGGERSELDEPSQDGIRRAEVALRHRHGSCPRLPQRDPRGG